MLKRRRFFTKFLLILFVLLLVNISIRSEEKKKGRITKDHLIFLKKGYEELTPEEKFDYLCSVIKQKKPKNIREKIYDRFYSEKLIAIEVFPYLEEIDIKIKAKVLLDALKEEIENPSEKKKSGYIPLNTNFKMGFSKSLGNMGKEVIPILKEYERSTEDEFKKWLMITYGLAGDNRYVDEICDILINKDEDMWMRALAADALGKIKDKETIGILKNMLNDESYSEVIMPVSKSISPDGKRINRYYPVRIKSAKALQEMGVLVRKIPPYDEWHYQVEEE